MLWQIIGKAGLKRCVLYVRGDVRKPTIWSSDQVRHIPACTVTEEGQKLEISELRRWKIVLFLEGKHSAAVTAQLISAFALAYVKADFQCKHG